MKAVVKLSRRATYADYLSIESTSEHRNEFIDGVIVAMAGGSDEHNALISRLGYVLIRRLVPPCRSYSTDQRFWIEANGRARYADGSIICGPPEHPPHDRQATTNPVVVFEVLSPSSEGDDEGEKRHEFQSIPSLRAYVLISQEDRRVKVYRRSQGADWRLDADLYGDGQSFELPALGETVPVAEIYEGILDAAGRSLLR